MSVPRNVGEPGAHNGFFNCSNDANDAMMCMWHGHGSERMQETISLALKNGFTGAISSLVRPCRTS